MWGVGPVMLMGSNIVSERHNVISGIIQCGNWRELAVVSHNLLSFP